MTLAVTAGQANPRGTAGMAGASDHAVPAASVAVKNQTGLKTVAAPAMAGGGVLPVRLVEPPPFHGLGAPSLAHFHLVGSYDDPDEKAEAQHIAQEVIAHLRDDAPQTARRVLEESEGAISLEPEDLNALRLRVAAGLLHDGDSKAALLLAEASITPGDDAAPWIAGLAAYRLHQSEKAARYFTLAADRQDDPWSQSAAAFWVARALRQGGDADRARPWLYKAAAHQGTFYGLLARRALDEAPGKTGAVKHDAARIYGAGYEVPRWKPRGGFTVDPALIFAVMRQESKFDPQAQSQAGAIGLMQIMPATAGHVTQRRGDWETELLNPETNMDIGQRYIRTLLQSDAVGNNLLRLAVAYNSGPSALGRSQAANDNDALMYLETIQAGETKGFAQQVLANYWNYRLRLRQDTASLSDMAAGKWPVYAAPSARPIQLADAR